MGRGTLRAALVGALRAVVRPPRVARLSTALEPVVVLAALHDEAARPTDCAAVRFSSTESDPLVLECSFGSGARAEVRLDERTAGGCRVRCRAASRGSATREELDGLHRCLRALVEHAEQRAGGASAQVPEQENPYARTGWTPPRS